MSHDLGAIALAPARNLGSIDLVHEGVVMMDADEARQIVKNIQGRLAYTRRELLEMHDREGWRALGYSSWGACVKAEFAESAESAATLYRQLEAAIIERDVLQDSQLENPAPIPTKQLQAVKQLAPADRPKAFKRADQLAGGSPRTARHVAQAAAEIAEPDLPPEFAIVQRRLEKHGHELTSHAQGEHRVYSIKRPGMTGVAVFDWANVLDRLERMDANPPPPPPPTKPDPVPVDNAAAYAAKEARDSERLAYAQSCADAGLYDTARAALNGVQVSTYARDTMLTEIDKRERMPAGRTITLALTFDECAALLKEARWFSGSELTKKLPMIGQTLVLMIEAIKGEATEVPRPPSPNP